MKATEMHDLLREVRAWLHEHVEIWHDGEGQFQHIRYCTFCSYSQSHGHGEKCLLTRLESAVNPQVKQGD
jgi:hypothetical protein